MEVPARRWTVEERSRGVHVVRMTFDQNEAWEQWVLLTADRHWDNPKSNHALQYKHLRQARERGAMVVDVGDWLCLMQTKGDKRGSKSAVRPEHNADNYLDAVVETAAEAFAPFADLFVVIGTGNHETKIIKTHETDITARFVDRLNQKAGTNVYRGGYGGWVRFQFTGTGNVRLSKNLKYYHGSGGGGIVTKGTLEPLRRAAIWPDADIVVSGHIHQDWYFPITRERLMDSGRQHLDNQIHISCSTYKDEYSDGYGGWHIETGKPPKPIGARWLRFTWDRALRRIKCDSMFAD